VFVNEQIRAHTPAESKAYKIDVSNLGSTPSSVTMTFFDITDENNPTDVSSSKLTGSTSVAGNVITSKLIRQLLTDRTYRAGLIFTTSDGNIHEINWDVPCL